MKKLFSILAIFLFTITTAFSADMRFVQIEGAFYNAGDKASVQRFEKVINDVNNLGDVDFVVFTGNNILNPSKDNLTGFLKAAKKLKSPYYIVLGTKDVNRNKGLSKEQYMKLVSKKNRAHKKFLNPNYYFEKNGMVFVIADGSKETLPSSMGYYKPDVMEFLNNTLTLNQSKKVVIFQHYPVVFPNNKESRFTFKADEYLKMLSEHKNVKAIFAGNFNVNSEKTVDGVLHVTTTNLPTYRVVDILDYDTENPTFWSTIKEY